MELLLVIASYAAIPVLALHIVFDIFDKHRHGIRVHDAVGVLAYAVLALHFALDFVGLFA